MYKISGFMLMILQVEFLTAKQGLTAVLGLVLILLAVSLSFVGFLLSSSKTEYAVHYV